MSHRLLTVAAKEALLLSNLAVRFGRSGGLSGGGDAAIVRVPLLLWHLPFLAAFFVGLIVLRASRHEEEQSKTQ